MALRLAAELNVATLRWATWAQQVVAGWETPLSADAAWGVETLGAAGEPFSESRKAERARRRADAGRS
jgi:hypothetical protein